MRENAKAFSELPVVTTPGYAASSKRNTFFEDTLVRSVAGSNKANWYTTGHGDCLASFTYKLFTDKYHPVLLLKEWNHWGGCSRWQPNLYLSFYNACWSFIYVQEYYIDGEIHGQ